MRRIEPPLQRSVLRADQRAEVAARAARVDEAQQRYLAGELVEPNDPAVLIDERRVGHAIADPKELRRCGIGGARDFAAGAMDRREPPWRGAALEQRVDLGPHRQRGRTDQRVAVRRRGEHPDDLIGRDDGIAARQLGEDRPVDRHDRPRRGGILGRHGRRSERGECNGGEHDEARREPESGADGHARIVARSRDACCDVPAR